MGSRRTIPAILLALGLSAGPATAACANCCPEADSAKPTALTLPACCDGCPSSADRAPDSASPVKATLTDFGADASIACAVPIAIGSVRSGVLLPVIPSSRSAPLISLAPLRL